MLYDIHYGEWLFQNLWLSPGPLILTLQSIDSWEWPFLLGITDPESLPVNSQCFICWQLEAGRQLMRLWCSRMEWIRRKSDTCRRNGEVLQYGSWTQCTMSVIASFPLQLSPSGRPWQYPSSFGKGLNGTVNIYCMWQQTVFGRWRSSCCVGELLSV